MVERSRGRISLPPTAGATPFIGRAQELEKLGAWMQAGRRLMTIVGPPGVGKTRLASVFTETVLTPACEGRVLYLDVSGARSVTDLNLLAAHALNLSLTIDHGARAEGAVAAALAARGRAAVWLDNVDGLAAVAAPWIGRLVELAPAACFLVTSRERLLLRSEQLLALGPLGLPPEEGSDGELGGAEAVALFLDRLHAVRPEHQAAGEELRRIAEIVRLLDGLPLAIELAAAKMTVLGSADLLRRLSQRTAPLRREHRDASARHLSLEDAIDASWALLSPWEQDALEQCSVFRGGFDLEAAEAVLDLSAHADAGSPSDALERLCDRSLLVARESPETFALRFSLYLTIRDFAARKLSEKGPSKVTERHARHFATRGIALARDVERSGTLDAARPLLREIDNLRAARSAPADDPEAVAALALALAPLAHEVPAGEWLSDLDRALASPGVSAAPRTRLLAAKGRALVSAGRFAEALAALAAADRSAEVALCEAFAHAGAGDRTEALARAAAAEALARAEGDGVLEARALVWQATEARSRGKLHAARALAARAVDLARAGAAVTVEGWASLALGGAEADLGRGDQAERSIQVGLAAGKRSIDPRLEVSAATSRAALYLDTRRAAQARAVCRDALAVAARCDDPQSAAAARVTLAFARLDEGELEGGEADLAAEAAALEEGGDRALLALVLAMLAAVRLDRFAEREPRPGARTPEDEAARQLHRACELARDAAEPRVHGLCVALRGWAELCAGRPVVARESFDAAEQILGEMDPVPEVEAAALARAHVEVHAARAAEARADAKEAARLRERARGRLVHALTARSIETGSPPPPVERSFWVRMIARGVERALPPRERALLWTSVLDPSGETLVLHAPERSFRPPGGDWVDLSPKRLLWRLLSALVSARRDGATAFLSTADVVPVLWPGERILPEAAATRVYSAVAQLRKLGLRELLESGPDGYRVAPLVPVIEVPHPF